MVDNLNTFSARLKHARKARGLSLAAVAAKLGVTAQAVHKWEQGGQIEPARQASLARALDVSIEWLIRGEGSVSDKLMADIELPSMPSAAVDERVSVPLMNTEFMLQWLLGNGTRVAKGVEWIPCPAPHGPRTFAIKVSDDSMENRDGPISYSVGDILFIDPDRKYALNTRVALFDHTANNDSLTSIREMYAQDGKMFVRALNPAWKAAERELSDNERLSGTVIGMWRPE